MMTSWSFWFVVPKQNGGKKANRKDIFLSPTVTGHVIRAVADTHTTSDPDFTIAKINFDTDVNKNIKIHKNTITVFFKAGSVGGANFTCPPHNGDFRRMLTNSLLPSVLTPS